MPSILQPWCRDYPDDARRKNFAKALASPRYHKPRPWRSEAESHMIKRFAFLWFTAAGSKPSVRSWAAQLGVSRTWLQKLVREFRKDPTEMLQAQAIEGDPRLVDLERARERSQEMWCRGELRPREFRQWKRLRREERAYDKNRRLKAEAEIPFGREWKRRMRASRNAPK